jgi:hypothetical protein
VDPSGFDAFTGQLYSDTTNTATGDRNIAFTQDVVNAQPPQAAPAAEGSQGSPLLGVIASSSVQAKDAARDDTSPGRSDLEVRFAPGLEGFGGGAPNRKLSTGGGGAGAGEDVARQLTPTDDVEIARNWANVTGQAAIRLGFWGIGGPATMVSDVVLAPTFETYETIHANEPFDPLNPPLLIVAAVDDPAAAAPVLERAALEVADKARGLSPRPGAVAALVANGEAFTGMSGRTDALPLHPEVQAAYDAVPVAERSPFHGTCAEGRCISRALNAGANPKGGTLTALRVRAEGNANHGTVIPPCPSCARVLEWFGITFSE